MPFLDDAIFCAQMITIISKSGRAHYQRDRRSGSVLHALARFPVMQPLSDACSRSPEYPEDAVLDCKLRSIDTPELHAAFDAVERPMCRRRGPCKTSDSM